MKLFPTLDDLKPFIFRITDNGGESADRFTVITNDGDYYAMSGAPFHPQGVGMSGEGIDVAGVAERVEAGVERDLRWIDLPADCQRCVLGALNDGYQDYIDSAPAAANRDEALRYEGWGDYEYRSRRAREKDLPSECIYRDGLAYKVRCGDEEDDYGPFDTFAEAYRYILPDDYDLSGPEYHSTVALWDTEGGPAPLWDRDEDPPVIDANSEYARAAIKLDTGGENEQTIAWFATVTDAENFLAQSATIDPDHLDAGHYTIDDLDHPDAPTRRD